MPQTVFSRLILSTALFGLMALSSGCDSRAPLVCSGNSSCPGGHVCNAGSCQRLCENDNNCSPGEFCDGTTCIAGVRRAPVIASITGKSEEQCTPNGTPAQNCIGTSIVVRGQNLAGSSFVLTSSEPNGGSDIPLVAHERNESEVVDLGPTTGGPALVAGAYTLVATNAAGSDEGNISLLQGEGGQGERGPPGVKGDQGDQGLRGPAGATGTGGGTEYDTVCPADGNCQRVTNVASPARMVITVAVKGTPAATETNQVAIDDTAFMDICGDADGCDVSVGVSGILRTSTAQVMDVPWSGGTCHLFVREGVGIDGLERHWSVANDCINIYASNGTQGQATKPTPLVEYVRYLTHNFGIDGNGEINNGKVLEYYKACLLTTSAPDVSGDTSGPLTADAAKGFHFIAVGDDWFLPRETSLTNVQHTCTLVLRD